MRWAGDMISVAKDPNQVIVAIADIMAALNAAYNKPMWVHTEFGFATYARDKAGTVNHDIPESIKFQFIRSLRHPEAPRMRLDNWESLLYLVICLGTYSIDEERRKAFIATLPKGWDLHVMLYGAQLMRKRLQT
ncbi:hypothetical protein GGI20_002735 [Coemansia sp. BCRC 34301]|nr:hypothetical protein GGI20_002735 [Coemansia sp. BCRC 34301]